MLGSGPLAGLHCLWINRSALRLPVEKASFSQAKVWPGRYVVRHWPDEKITMSFLKGWLVLSVLLLIVMENKWSNLVHRKVPYQVCDSFWT